MLTKRYDYKEEYRVRNLNTSNRPRVTEATVMTSNKNILSITLMVGLGYNKHRTKLETKLHEGGRGIKQKINIYIIFIAPIFFHINFLTVDSIIFRQGSLLTVR